MYYSGQTLRKKGTTTLVKLVPSGDSDWAWEISNKTPFYNEQGKIFHDDIDNYEPIQNELGQYQAGIGTKTKPDLSLRKYLIEDIDKMREETLSKWEQKLLSEMKESNAVHSPFANGSKCFLFQEYFLKKRNAKPLYMAWNYFEEHVEKKPKQSWNKSVWENGPMTFRLYRKQWVYDSHLGCLRVIKFNS